ncbi:MAG: VacB/RNase II family 3'-5' exoribonuclease, partial [Mariprofundaceae bacterium]
VGELDLPAAFPPAVLRECEAIPDEVEAAAIKGREDLRHLHFVTIDGEDARDFDDAICVRPRGEGFEAWVAIADVAHYVRPGTALDAEALSRSNSFYFPDRVIPMLPEKLSNGLCSLNPDVPRLAMAVRMRFDAAGKRRSVQVYDAVIHSRARLTYAQTARWIDDGDTTAIASRETREMLTHAARLHERLLRRRRLRGALDLDVPEVRAVLHEGRIADLGRTERNTAHHLIEELMLAANTAVAEYMESKSCPLLYRVHPAPEAKAIEELNAFLKPFGLHIRVPKKGSVRPGDIQDILDAARDKPFAHVLHRLVLRAMQQARYTPENEGHFGLAFKSYCHFTSPIRRYADLTVHRRLKALIHGQNPDAEQPAKGLAAIGERTSTQERKQQRGEWDVQAMFAALYHKNDVGRELPARISGMSKRRLFVEFDETLAEGSMGVEELGDGYELDESGHRLIARRGGARYTLGDEIRVRITAVDPVRGQIDVTLAEA